LPESLGTSTDVWLYRAQLVHRSYTEANKSGKTPFPMSKESVVGGHAIVAVGFDDKMKIKNLAQVELRKPGRICSAIHGVQAGEIKATAGSPTSTSCVPWQWIGGR